MLRQGGLIECEEVVGVKKKVEGSQVGQPTLRLTDQTGGSYLCYTEVGTKVGLLKIKGI